jgi:hypothetical protein
MPEPLKRSLISMNSRGIIPGPDESEEKFWERAEYYTHLRSKLSTELSKEIPFDFSTEENESCLKEVFNHTQACFDIAPDWVPLFFSDYQLRPWQGGCAWIFQITEESPAAALIQLRKHFRYSKHYLYMYNRMELLSHELSHVGRLAFEEPKFEEFFSYSSSKSAFRKWFGPIIQSSFESLLFVIILLMILIFDISVITMGSSLLSSFTIWSKVILFSIIAAAALRLYWRHRQFNNCFDQLYKLVRCNHKASAVMYRLTDLEISSFSRMEFSEIREYMDKHKGQSLRWKVIHEAYLSQPAY